MTARTPVEFVNLQGQRVGNKVQIDGAAGGSNVYLVDAAGADIDSANPLPVVFYRGNLDIIASFAADTTSDFIDKRKFAMVEIGPIPAAMNGRDVTVLSAPVAAGTGAVVPRYLNSAGAYVVYVTLTGVATGQIYTIQADAATIHYIGFGVSGAAITADLPVRLTA